MKLPHSTWSWPWPWPGRSPEAREEDQRPLPALTPLRAGRDPDRFEIKYWVPEALAEEVVRHVAPYVEADVHDGDEESGGQVNTSLYLDTPDFAFFHAHDEHSRDRSKLRVRAYGDPPRGLCFFEVKRKINKVSVKTRANLPLSMMMPILEGSWDTLPPLKPSERRHLEHFLYLKTVTHAEPTVLLRARRVAFASSDPMDDIRVTFDRAICFQPARGATMDCDPDGWIPIDGTDQHGQYGRPGPHGQRGLPGGAGPHAMLELKFPGIAPLWMRQLTEKLEMRRVAYSKYMWAIRTMLGQPFADQRLHDLQLARGA